jgi:peptide chain release factor 1
VSDHRIGLTLYKLQEVLNGDLEDIINPLIAHFQSEALKKG